MKKWKQLLNPIFLLYILSGGICGLVIARTADRIEFMKPLGGIVLSALIFYFLFILQLVLHEGGHLVAGLMSGYSFVSFRVFSWMIAKEEGKIRLRRFNLAGTAGQCLLDPPPLKDGRIPVRFYNLGGVLANGISAIIGIVGAMLVGSESIAFSAFLVLAVLGIGMALANGIPFSTGMVNNDGYNVKNLDKDATEVRGFFLQLKVNAEQQRGVRLSDMPEDWFAMPSDQDLKKVMSATQAVLSCNRLLEIQDFAATAEQIETLLAKDTAIMGLHRALLTSDLVYCLLMLDADPEKIKSLLTPEQRKSMKAMVGLPCIQRSEYAIALLLDGDQEKAAKLKERFMKMEKSYPYKAEFESERSLLERAENLVMHGDTDIASL